MKKITFFSLFYLLFLLSLSTYAQNIVSTNPSLNANQVAVDANLSITFDTVITPSLFNEISITVSGAQTGTIAGTFSGVNTNTITFNPDQNFKNGELISISASSSFGGLVGSFTTATNQVSQVIFSGAANVIATGSNGSINVYPADLDGDGYVDVLSATLNTNTIAWQKNDGNGNFLAQQIITTSVNQARDVFAADLDGDGDLDVISASSGDDRLAWYENDGLGNFGPQQNITIVENETRRVYAADMDGDGDMDVYSTSINTNSIAWYENNNNGTTWIRRSISNSDGTGRDMQAADFDNDGDLDMLVLGNSSNERYLFKNDGNGNFGSRQVIPSSPSNIPWDLHITDLNNDGNLDMLIAFFSTNVISWQENDGTGNFGAPQTITPQLNNVSNVSSADVDGDGDMDVLSSSIGDDRIAWYPNDGLGGFGAQQTITTTADFVSDLYVVDLDNDGNMDVLSALASTNKIVWYENLAARRLISTIPDNNSINVATSANIVLTFDSPVPSSLVNTNNIVITGNQTAPIAGTFSGQDTSTITFNPNSDFKPGEIISVSVTSSIVANPTVLRFTASVSPDSPGEFANGENVISTTADAATDVISADIDGDGDIDVLSASFSDDTIAWYANDGLGNFGIAQNISTSANGAQSVTTADIDGDGDIDVLSASSNDDTIAWYANDGLGNFGTAQNITTSADGAQSVTTADIDGDGDLDVFSASSSDDTIAWYANDGLGNFGIAQNISTSADGAQSVTTADIDGDGDLDVLSASFSNDTIAWYANDGLGNFGVAQNITTSANGAHSVTTADIDGDGDLDVLSASVFDDTIAWYANDGSGNFGIAQNISTSANAARSVTTADIDGDGDLDVLSASSSDDTIAWYANDGLGNFGIAQNISTSANGAQSVTTADIDGDGDLDVLSASSVDDKIAWYENVSPPDCLDATTYTIAGGWDNGDPTETKTAIIAESYSTSFGNITACSLVILDGAILTVEADTFVQIENDISVDGYLLVAHTGSVVQIDDDAVVTGAGSFSVLVDTPELDVRDFMIMGSPMDAETRENVWASAWNVQNYTPANFNPVVAVTDAYNFADAELDDWNLYTTGPLAAGEGFLVRPQTSLNGAGGVFAYDYNTGFLTNGVVTRPLNYNTTQLDSPNMLSNPYPSAIDADVFLDPIINPDIDAVYFWEHILAPDPSFPGSSTTGPNYSMGDVSFYNAMGGIGSASGSATPSNVISTAQGFGIFSNNPAGGTATFNNSMRLTTGNTTLRAPELNRNRLWLHITSDIYTIGGTTLVGFTENATAGFDRRYDSQRVATHVSLFSHIDTDDTGYAIQGREVFNTEMTIALGFSSIIEEETSYTISLSDFDGIAWETNSPYLEDTITGIVTNLNESSYRFTSDSGVFNNRFILKFKDKEVLDIVENTLSQITILPNPTTGLVIVNSPLAMITTISVLDVRGRVILRSNNVADFNRQIDLSNVSSAVYFINVTTENGTVIKRIIKK